jgi:hypothetical protein
MQKKTQNLQIYKENESEINTNVTWNMADF